MAACREVAEETGIPAVAGRRLDVGHYRTRLGPKVVDYWAMQGPEVPFTPSSEVDAIVWLPLAEARRRVSYLGDTYAIDALEAMAASATITATVLLVRSGRATPTAQWAGADQDRPLSSRGHTQAEWLRPILRAFMPVRLLSPPGIRFADTIRPLAAELDATVAAEPALAEEVYAAHPGRGMTMVQQLACAGPRTAVCASGAVIRHLIAGLAAESGLWPGEVRARKASAWALYFSGRCLTSADYYELPPDP